MVFPIHLLSRVPRYPFHLTRINFEQLHIFIQKKIKVFQLLWFFLLRRIQLINIFELALIRHQDQSQQLIKQQLFLLIMLKEKYTIKQTLKQRGDKLCQKCIKGQQSYFIKSYSNQSKKQYYNQLQIYQAIKEPYIHGITQIKQIFQQNHRFYMVFQQFGSNLDILRIKCGGKLSLKTVLQVGLQMLQRIEYLHNHGILHGDIKPSNFVIGKGKMKHKIFLTDFQLSSFYIKNGKHISQEGKETFSGSLRFCSKSLNMRHAVGRKDQLQSWFYCLIYLLKGQLPWRGLSAQNIQQANQQILICKQRKNQLIEGLPDIFRQIIEHISELKFTSSPDYRRVNGLLKSLMKKNGYQNDYKYDWQYL